MKCLMGLAAMIAAGALAQAADVAPRDGDYLSATYLAVLEKTKSHYRAYSAWQGSAPQAITVSHDKRGMVLDLGFNWHEGTTAVFDRQGRSIGEEADSRSSFRSESTERFHFKEGDEPMRTYRYVGNALRYLAGKLLIGTYSDTNGIRYEFREDGTAHFPDRTFRYELYLDMVFEHCDLYTDLTASKPNAYRNYGFAWNGETLYLYNTDCWRNDDPGCKIDRKHPIAVLKRIGGAK